MIQIIQESTRLMNHAAQDAVARPEIKITPISQSANPMKYDLLLV